MESAGKLASVLFGGLFTVLTAALLGRILLARLSRVAERLTRAEGWIFSLAVGAAALSMAVFALCAAGLVYDATFWLAGLAVLLGWRRWGRWPASQADMESQDLSWLWRIFVLASAAFYAVVYVPHVLAPETRADAVGYHLGLISRYYRSHGFVPITTNVYAFLSQGVEMLYLFAFALGRDSAAKIVHFGFLVATVGGLLTFSWRYQIPRAGVTAAVLYFCCPVVIPDATAAYNDCALAFYLFLTFYALNLWWRDQENSWLWAIGALAGFCFAIKYTGYLAVPAALAVVAWKSWRRRRLGLPLLRPLFVTGLAASAFVLPWLAKNVIVAGNPVAPFYNSVFPNPYVSVDWEKHYREGMKYYGQPQQSRWRQLLEAPAEVAYKGLRYQGIIGPVFLLTPLALLGWRSPLMRALLAAALISALPWLDNAGTRFLIPSVLFLSLALGLLLERLPKKPAAVTAGLLLSFHAVSSFPPWKAYWYDEHLWSVDGLPWRAAFRLEPELQYVAQKVPFFHTADHLAKLTDQDDRVLSLDALPEYFIPAEVLIAYQGRENEQLAQALRAGIDPDWWPAREIRAAWPRQRLSGFRLVQTNSHESSPWLVSELRLFNDGNERIPQTGWRIRARPFPWEAARIFDGNPMTAWNSWQPLEPGMYVEVRFPQALALDEAHLIYPRGQHFSEFEYWGRLPGREWRRLEASKTRRLRPVSAARVRAWAGEELRRHGIDYLALNAQGDGYNTVAPAIAENPRAWGLKKVARHGIGVIYKVLGADATRRRSGS